LQLISGVEIDIFKKWPVTIGYGLLMQTRWIFDDRRVLHTSWYENMLSTKFPELLVSRTLYYQR